MTALRLRTALATAQGAAPLNEAQRLALFNPDPEVNSLAERIVALRTYGVPAPEIKALLADIRAVLHLNDREGRRIGDTCAQLDDLARMDDLRRVIEKPSIKRLAAQIRPHLAVLRDPDATGADVAEAAEAIAALLDACPRAYLASPTLRRQLGDGPYRQLLDLAGARGQENPPA